MKTNEVFQREEEVNSESIESYANEEESEEAKHVRRPTPDDIEISKDCMLKAWVGSP